MKQIIFICTLFFLVAGLANAQQQKIPKYEAVEVKNLETVNSGTYEFSPVRYGNGIMFTTDRGGAEKYNPESNRTGKCKCNCEDERAIERRCTDIFFAEKGQDGTFKKPVPIKGELNGTYHDGAITFSPDKTRMYLTRNNSKNKARMNLQIYSAELKGDRWVNVKALPFNSDSFNTAHPTLTSDGKRMFFSSNRPGTLGKMDLWVSDYVNGQWSNPRNLGPEVNTEKDEIFPFISPDNTLYFSTDGRQGLGGLDFYKTERTNPEDWTSWGNVRNMGVPFNSDKDDLSFYTDNGETEGYFASGRAGGQGGDDIYTFNWNKKNERYNKQILVYDAKTGEPIEESTISVNGDFGGMVDLRKMLTNPKGIIIHQLVPETEYQYAVSKTGYIPKKLNLTAKELMEKLDEPYRIPLEKAPFVPITVYVRDSLTGEPLPGARVTLINKRTGLPMEFVTGPNGEIKTNIDCDTEYEVVATKEDYSVSRQTIAATPCDKITPRETTLLINKRLYVGKVITLKNIYYDFDKYNIRPDASKELDYVVNLLNTYRSMELELGSHTDCRGSFAYNDRLSDNRAKSAVEYIIKKGNIDPKRIVAKGYGEYQLTNECKDGVKCSEPKHQLNRRTEIKITKFNEGGIGVDPNVKK